MANTTALLKSAASTRATLADYQDRIRAFDYGNSAYTDSAYNEYSKYLQGRVSELTKAGGISNASKALSLTETLQGATKSNISSSIQRENIQIMSGNSSLTDKYNLVAKQFVRAQSIGDLTLAQGLESQAYSISQTIQVQAQQAADAATALAKANAKASADGEGANPVALKQSLAQLNNDIKLGGVKEFDKTVRAWVDTNRSTLESLGVKLPNNAQPNYFDVVHGVAGAIINHDSLAAKAYAPYDPARAQSYANDAYNLANGLDGLQVLGGKSMTLPEITQAAAGNNEFLYNPSTGELVKTPQTGNKLTLGKAGNAVVTPTYSGKLGDSAYKVLGNKLNDQGMRVPTGETGHTTFLTATQTALMAKMGLKFAANKDGTAGNGVQVESTATSPDWVKNVLGDHGVTSIYGSSTGLQFTFDSKSGTGLSTYTVITDNNGFHGLGEESNTGSRILGGQNGFDPLGTTNTNSNTGGFLGNLENGIKAGLNDFSGMFMGHASAMGLPNGSQLLQGATNHYTLPAPQLNLAPPQKLPTLHLAAPTPQPALAISSRPVVSTKSVQPASSGRSIQNAAGGRAVQSTGGQSLQGGGAYLQ